MGGGVAPGDSRWWTVKEFAAALRRHPETIRKWIRRGVLVSVQVNGTGQYLLPDPSSCVIPRKRARR
jgi:excisionase family DNA binding protein